MAPKSVSSQTTTSGRQSAHRARSSSARSRASRPAKPARNSRCSRSGSSSRIGIRFGGRSAPVGKKSSSSSGPTAERRPVSATVWPAAAAARARGTSGSACPVPPANVKRRRLGRDGLHLAQRREAPERVELDLAHALAREPEPAPDLLFGKRPVAGDEVAEDRVLLVADGLVEARRGPRGGEHLVGLLDRQARLL